MNELVILSMSSQVTRTVLTSISWWLFSGLFSYHFYYFCRLCPDAVRTAGLRPRESGEIKMAENLRKVPVRGILKQSSSFEQSTEETPPK